MLAACQAGAQLKRLRTYSARLLIQNIPDADTHQMSEEHDDEFDDSRCLEGGGHVRRIRFQDCVHPVVLGVVVYGAATAPAHRVCGLLRGGSVAGRALGDHAAQRPSTCEHFRHVGSPLSKSGTV